MIIHVHKNVMLDINIYMILNVMKDALQIHIQKIIFAKLI